MICNIEDLAPIDCGEPVNGMQPCIFDVTPIDQRPGSVWCPALADYAAGVAMVPVGWRLSFPDAFQAAIRLAADLELN